MAMLIQLAAEYAARMRLSRIRPAFSVPDPTSRDPAQG
jgi:hypothetical protein